MSALRRWLECRYARSAMLAYLDGEASAAAARVRRHLSQCPQCRALAEALAAQARLIEALPADQDPPEGFVGRVMQRVNAAQVRPSRVQLRWRPAFAAVAMAATAAIVACVFWLGPSRTGPTAGVRIASRHDVERVAPSAGNIPAVQPEVTSPREPTAPTMTVQAPPAPSRAQVVTTTVARRAESRVLAQQHRDTGQSLEDEGQLDQALEEYAAARDTGGSEMARLDMARVYEKSGYTDEALGELVQVAFSDVDQNSWEPLTVQ